MQVKQRGGWTIKWKYEISNDSEIKTATVNETDTETVDFKSKSASKVLENKRFIKPKATCDRQQ